MRIISTHKEDVIMKKKVWLKFDKSFSMKNNAKPGRKCQPVEL